MDMSSFNENKNDYGIITSRNYPTWISDENCNGPLEYVHNPLELIAWLLGVPEY